MAALSSITSSYAGRFATALFDLAKETGQIDAVLKDLNQFEALIAENADLHRFMLSPVFSSDDQVRALTPILEKTGIGGLTAKFLLLVASKRRLFAFNAMVAAFKALVDGDRGVVRATVTVAEQPSQNVLGAIKDALKDIAGDKAEIDLDVDPAIIGGIIVQIGSKMVDASLRTQLNGIRIAMKEVG